MARTLEQMLATEKAEVVNKATITAEEMLSAIKQEDFKASLEIKQPAEGEGTKQDQH